MLKTKVKVGKVTNLSEARYCAGMGVDFLSFPIAQIDAKTFQEITGWVAGPVFGIEVEKENLDLINQYEVDFVQTSVDSIDSISVNRKLVISIEAKDFFGQQSKLISHKDKILFLELSFDKIDFNTKSILEEASKDFEVFIKLSTEFDVNKILELPIHGISLEGVAETKPGLKEYPLSEILEQLEE